MYDCINSHKMLIERDPIADIEINVSEFEGRKGSENMLKSLVGTLSFEGMDEGEDISNSNRNLVKTDNEFDDIESLIRYKFEDEKREHMPLTDKKTQKHKTRSSKKPPRPRKGPSLSMNDLRLVKEISELVIKKRTRVERLKSSKKMRASKASSSSSKTSLVAMVITLIFFIIIVFQGFGSGKSSTLSFHETYQPLAARKGGLVSNR